MEYVVTDFKKSLLAWRFWTLFGYHDAFGPLHRTRFGLLFYTLQALLRATVIFLVLGPSIASGSSEYFGYVALGLPIFSFYSNAVTSGYGILSRNKAMIENGKVPFIACIFRFFIDQSVRFLFAIVIYFGFLVLHPSTLTLASLLLIPGLLVAIVFVFAVALTFMVISAFFPDLSEAVNAVMGILFFATPIFWYPGERGEIRNFIANANPFTHLISIVREPALGHAPEIISYVYACSLTLFLVGVSVCLFGIARNWMIFKL
ncbi:ABC transporter permease [Mesorhizobium sp. AaZ16]|uniref:ABC transporter permease n=1 Tax=Mesorhizobium sp. AaZ16 TaxID=3402289 RepID=UPI00374E6C22